ncbi:MAG: IMP cyclohydrolase [Desulfonatronovibrio sp.]
MKYLPIRRALLSVTDKSGLVRLASVLDSMQVEIFSTGGTAGLLRDNGLSVKDVSSVTGFPEILGGRVKTLHPSIHAGILADKDNARHLETIDSLGIKAFDLICVNLYDFASAVAREADMKEAVEKIDIGGPTLLRAAAKNFHSICVLPHPDFYGPLVNQLQSSGHVDLDLRRKTAWHTFDLTSKYDQMIADYFRASIEETHP